MTATTTFCVENAHLQFFASKEAYFAYKAAWKALVHSSYRLNARFYVAHAILTGRDLYKAFSPNQRLNQGLRPYSALADALVGLRHMSSLLEHRPLPLPAEQMHAYLEGLNKAIEVVAALNPAVGQHYADIGNGKGAFAATTVEA